MAATPLFVLDGRTATSHFPGIGRYVRGLLGALPQQLQSNEALGVILNPNQSKLKASLARNSNVIFYETQGSPFRLGQQWQIPRLLTKTSAQLYHSPYYLMPYWPGKPSILTYYDVISLRYPDQVSRQARLFFRWTSSLALRSAQTVIAISQHTRDDIHRYFQTPHNRIETIPLAAGPQFSPQSQPEIDRVRKVYSLPQDYVLYFGINKPHKNLERLIEAFDLLNNNGSRLADEVPLVIAGAWDPRYPESREKTQVLGIQERVHFLGPIPEKDLPGLFCGAHVFVFPSLYEGFGLPVLEAMACGVPVACSESSSLTEVAAGSAVLFDPHSTTGIAEALKTILFNKNLREELRGRGFQKAAEYSWEATAAATLNIYRTQE